MQTHSFWYLHGDEDRDDEDSDKISYDEKVYEADMKEIDGMIVMIRDIYPYMANEKENNAYDPQEPKKRNSDY